MVIKSINKHILGRIYHYGNLFFVTVIAYMIIILMLWVKMKIVSLAYP